MIPTTKLSFFLTAKNTSDGTFPKRGLKFIETENIYDKFEHKKCIVMDIRENQHIRGQI